MAKFVGMWEGNKDGCKQESESILIDQLISLAREFKLDFYQYVPIIQQPNEVGKEFIGNKLQLMYNTWRRYLLRK